MPSANRQILQILRALDGERLQIVLAEVLADHTARNLMLLQAALATYDGRLPAELRSQILSTLSLPAQSNASFLRWLLHDTQQHATQEQRTLGQMGYVLFWATILGEQRTHLRVAACA